MQFQNLILAIIVSIFSFASIYSTPAFSQEITSNSIQSELESEENSVIRIPAETSIIVSSSSLIQFEAKKDKKSEILLRLAEPIRDGRGRIIVPVDSRVLAIIESSDKKEVNLFVYGLVINGKAVPFQTSQKSLNTSKITIKNRFQQASEISSGIAPAGAILSLFNDNFNSTTLAQNTFIIHGAGTIFGLLSPDSKKIAQIPPNREYLLTLQEEIVLPESLLMAQVRLEPTEYEFSFQTILEYDRNLAAIIDAVDNKQITSAEATNIIQAAATYAQKEVFHYLYPSPEMRLKVSQKFGFIYEIDS